MANSFFKHNDKVYSENLNDSVLIGNSFSLIVDIGLPTDTGGVFPNSDSVVKAKVADVSVTPNSNLSIGETVSNTSGSSQEYRLTVYPNFNRFGGFQSVSLDGDGTFFIANKGGNAPIVDNLDYDDLSDVPELKVLKEYDIVVSIPNNGVVSGLDFIFQSSNADVASTINMSNITGLDAELETKPSKVEIYRNNTEGNVVASISTIFRTIAVSGTVRNGWAYVYFVLGLDNGGLDRGVMMTLNAPYHPLYTVRAFMLVYDSVNEKIKPITLNSNGQLEYNSIERIDDTGYYFYGTLVFPILDYGEE